MERREFITAVGVASVAAVAASALEPTWAHAAPRPDLTPEPPQKVDERFLRVLTAVNDRQVPVTLSNYQRQIDSGSSPRTLAQSALRLVSAYSNERGANYHRADLLAPVATLLTALAARQNPSGLYDIGNLDSPPDTSFVISDLGLASEVLLADGDAGTEPIRSQYAAIMKKSARALIDGGVHTPNHRWEICKALAHLNHLWPSRALKARINDWLGEGIDQDREGEYSERSPNYASEVTNRSLLIVARLADHAALRTVVSRNLELALHRIEPNGEIETVQSRRQDQTGIQDVWKHLTHFRELAIREKNGRFAAVAEQIVDRVEADPARFATEGYSVGEFLAEALAYPDLTAVLPNPVALPAQYTRTYRGSSLVRLRRGVETATVFGGTDLYNRREDPEGNPITIREIASGLSTNPTFFKFRKGAAILDSVRMSPRFFSTGHFRSDGIEAAGKNAWRLSSTVKVPYHLPLPNRYRRTDGEYDLGSEGRFYSRMDFAHRPKQYKTLKTEILVRESMSGGYELRFDVDGPATTLTIELCFRAGGTLTGVQAASGDGNYQLVNGQGGYTAGGDTITFGPGNGAGAISMDSGERYSYLNGSLTPSGQRVYITGAVPFRYTLRIR